STGDGARVLEERTNRQTNSSRARYYFAHRRVGLPAAARTAMTVAFISSSDCGRHDTGWGHPEHVGRLRAIPKALREDPDLFGRIQHVESRHATDDELALVHDPGYVAAVRATIADGGGRLDADTVVSAGSWDAA